jgi:hypothetical protein
MNSAPRNIIVLCSVLMQGGYMFCMTQTSPNMTDVLSGQGAHRDVLSTFAPAPPTPDLSMLTHVGGSLAHPILSMPTHVGGTLDHPAHAHSCGGQLGAH